MNAAKRRNRIRSGSVSSACDQSTDARNVCCRRTAVRAPPVRSRKRSCRLLTISSSESARTRAAASSMASGIPSRRRQISVTVSVLSSVTVKSGRARRARSVNNSTASSARDSDGTCQFTSPATMRGSRLVARIVTREQPASTSLTSSALASSRCSQLSNTTSSRRSRTDRNSVSVIERPGWSGSPSARATVSGTTSGCGDRRQIGIENAVGEVTAHLAGDLDRQPGLARSACAGQGHEPVVGQRTADLRDLRCAADEARQLSRKIMSGNGIRCPQRREVVAQIGMAQLRNPNGAGEVAQPVAAQIGQPRVIGKLVFDHFLGCGRHDGLAAVCQVAQPSGLVDRRAGVVAFVAQLHVAGVNSDAKLDRGEFGALQVQRAPHRVAGARERGNEAVALTLFDRAYPAVLGDERRGGPVQKSDGGRHRLRPVIPQLCRALDIGKQQRHRAGRQQLGHVNIAPLSRAHAVRMRRRPWAKHQPKGAFSLP